MSNRPLTVNTQFYPKDNFLKRDRGSFKYSHLGCQLKYIITDTLTIECFFIDLNAVSSERSYSYLMNCVNILKIHCYNPTPTRKI